MKTCTDACSGQGECSDGTCFCYSGFWGELYFYFVFPRILQDSTIPTFSFYFDQVRHASSLPAKMTVTAMVNAQRRASACVNLGLPARAARTEHALTAQNTGLAIRKPTNASACLITVARTAPSQLASFPMGKFAVAQSVVNA